MSVIGPIRTLPVAVQNLVTSPSGASNGAAGPTPAITSGRGSDGGQDETVRDPLTALLEALCHGDLGAAKVELSQLTRERKGDRGEDADSDGTNRQAGPGREGSREPGSDGATEDEGAGDTGSKRLTPAVSDVDHLVDRVSAALEAGGTDAALKELTDYLVRTGRVSGNLLRIAA